MRQALLPALVSLAMVFLPSGCSQMKAPPPKPGGLGVGDQAYPFKLMDSQNRWVQSSDIQEGWYLVLVLFRGSWCSSCVDELNELKRDFGEFQRRKAAIVCVSSESTADLAEFQRQWRFPFPLLSDLKLKVIDAYGARHPKGHEGKDISFSCIVISDPGGTIVYRFLDQRPQNIPNNAEILGFIDRFQKNPVPKP
jgi:peroxiredoxin